MKKCKCRKNKTWFTSTVFLHNVLFIHGHEMYMIHKSRILLRVLGATASIRVRDEDTEYDATMRNDRIQRVRSVERVADSSSGSLPVVPRTEVRYT